MNQMNSVPQAAAAKDGAAYEQLLEQLQRIANMEVPERPKLAANVELRGEMPETGFAEQQWLVERGGQFVQVTELLYKTAALCNGERTLEQIAEGLSESTQWIVTEEHVCQLVKKLLPLGLVVPANGEAFSVTQDGLSPLRVNMRKKVIGAHIIKPIAQFLQVLFAPPLLIPLLVVILVSHGWLYLEHGSGLINGFLSALYKPWQFFVVLGVMVVAGIFHELGHAAGLSYGGGRVREAGVGIYLIYPVLYTDTTDAYRLGRWGRVRTDLGGFYFYLLFSAAMIGVYLLTGQAFLLLVVVLINLDFLYQLLPFVRFDGYWALADLTGIPDFFSQMKPFVASILRQPHAGDNRLPALKPWVKVVFIAYTILTLPVLALLYFFMIRRLPIFLDITWQSYIHHFRMVAVTLSNGNYLALAALVLQMLLLAFPLLGVLYVLYAFSWPLLKALWSWSRPTPLRRLTGATAASGMVVLLAYLWTPNLAFLNHQVPEEVQTFEVTERNHVEEPVSYAQWPPVGGDHAPVWQNCGYYDAPVPAENAVHSMEHGAVWITYRPDLPEEQLQELRRIAHTQTYVLVSPDPQLSEPVVASAWGHQLALQSAEDPQLAQFLRSLRLGRQAPERGQPCTDGVGDPQ